MKPYNSVTELRTCHDVRHLVVCRHCKGLGDKRNMLGSAKEGRIHGRCYVDAFGLKALLSLPKKNVEVLTLGDVGINTAKALWK